MTAISVIFVTFLVAIVVLVLVLSYAQPKPDDSFFTHTDVKRGPDDAA